MLAWSTMPGYRRDKRRGKADIRHDKSVCPERKQSAGKLNRNGDFPAVKLRVEDNMRFHAEKPAVPNCLADCLLRKIFRIFRALKLCVPKYTASAPAETAARSASGEPAGASSSGFIFSSRPR